MIRPKDGSTYQRATTRLPRVRAEAGRVVVTLDIISVADPLDRPSVELLLEADIAQTLAAELVRAARLIEK